MTKILRQLGARLKRRAGLLRNAPLFVLCAAVSLSIEVYAWGAILNENVGTVAIFGHNVRLAYPELVMSTAFSLVALVLGAAAAGFKSDPRPTQRRRAFAAQCLAVMVLIVPVYYASNALAYQRQLADWREYSGSEAEAADRCMAEGSCQGGYVDSVERSRASIRLQRGVRPERADFNIESFLWVALVLGCNMAALRLGWRPRPETPAEAKARETAMRSAKAKFTRERNKRARLSDEKTNVASFPFRKAN